MNILDPYGWWALLGLLIPVIIHLLSKKEKSIVRFGSLKFLQPIDSESARSIQLSQYLLLLFRLVLLGLICLLLVGPSYMHDDENISFWIEEDIYKSEDYKIILEGLPPETNINLFSHQKSPSNDVRTFRSGWTLIDHLNTQGDSSVVYTYSFQKNFVGQQVLMGDRIDWKVIPLKTSQGGTNFLSTGPNTMTWSIISDKDQLAVQSQLIEEHQGVAQQSLRLKLVANGFEREADQIKSIIELTKEDLFYDIEWITNDQDNPIDWHILISDTHEEIAGHAIHWIPSVAPLLVSTVKEDKIVFSGKITKESILDSNLPIIIAAQFNKYFTSIIDHDRRVIDPISITMYAGQHSAKDQGITEISYNNQPIEGYIILLILPVFMAERFLNYKNDQET